MVQYILYKIQLISRSGKKRFIKQSALYPPPAVILTGGFFMLSAFMATPAAFSGGMPFCSLTDMAFTALQNARRYALLSFVSRVYRRL